MNIRGSTLLLIIVPLSVLSQTLSNQQVILGQLPRTQVSSVLIDVVFLGIEREWLDVDYLNWKGEAKNLPTAIEVVLDSTNKTRQIFLPQYKFHFAPQTFKTRFVSYLKSIETEKEGTNPWFYYWVQDRKNPDYHSRQYMSVKYFIYDADKVENWLWANRGGIVRQGDPSWIFFMYLSELPLASWKDVKDHLKYRTSYNGSAHYYSISRTDVDLGYQYRFRDFMSGWGGRNRLWFYDVSAGPVFHSQFEDLPLQVVLGDNSIELGSPFGRNWFTEYIADYLWQATLNLAFPRSVYDPVYSSKYLIDINVFDARKPAEKNAVPIGSTINLGQMEAAFRDLLPYSEMEVRLQFRDIRDDIELEQTVLRSFKFTDSWIFGSVLGSMQRYGIVDARPVYKFLVDHLDAYSPGRTQSEKLFVIPVFCFAFSEETYLSYT